MATDWQALGAEDKIEWLYAALTSLEKAVVAAQDDVSGLSNRLVELISQQNSTFELTREVVAAVERIDAGR